MRTPQRECIGIEALLVRAYREKRVDRLPADPRRLLGIRCPALPGASAMAKGDRVDTSSWGATAAAHTRDALAMLANAGDGLLAAHDLVLRLDDYFAEDHRTADLGFTLWTKAGAAEAGFAVIERHDRAYLQAAEVARTDGPEGETVSLTPIAGTRIRWLHKIVVAPVIVLAGWAAEAPYVSPVEVERLKPITCPRTRRRVGLEPVYVTPLDIVVQERAIYAAWHHALAALADQLGDTADLDVRPPCLPARPWEVETAAAA